MGYQPIYGISTFVVYQLIFYGISTYLWHINLCSISGHVFMAYQPIYGISIFVVYQRSYFMGYQPTYGISIFVVYQLMFYGIST